MNFRSRLIPAEEPSGTVIRLVLTVDQFGVCPSEVFQSINSGDVSICYVSKFLFYKEIILLIALFWLCWASVVAVAFL